jgi:indolepyruvate ferredoxin oxidoreductase, beta subunit
MKNEINNILMVGVGGQGIVLASDILGDVAIASGMDIKKTDTLGMAQRGGSVVSHVRIADKVYSPLIREGEVDLLLAFEKLEAVRWGGFLKPNGYALVNNFTIPPQSVKLGINKYPDDEEIKKVLKQRTDKFIFIEGSQKAIEMGDIRILNVFILGCISSLLHFDLETWKDCIIKRLPKKIQQINLQALDMGREVISNVAL